MRAWILTGAPRPDGRPCFGAGVDLHSFAEGRGVTVEQGFRLTNRIDDPAYAAVRRDLMNRLCRQLRTRGDNFHHWMATMFEVDVPASDDASLSGFGR